MTPALEASTPRRQLCRARPNHSLKLTRYGVRCLPAPGPVGYGSGQNLSKAPVPARVSAGRSSPGLAITSCRHRGRRVSAPKLLLLHFACTATTAARCLTPRSSRAPTASPQARSGGALYIFASPGLATHRRCRLNSNVRDALHKPRATMVAAGGLC